MLRGRERASEHNEEEKQQQHHYFLSELNHTTPAQILSWDSQIHIQQRVGTS